MEATAAVPIAPSSPETLFGSSSDCWPEALVAPSSSGHTDSLSPTLDLGLGLTHTYSSHISHAVSFLLV